MSDLMISQTAANIGQHVQIAPLFPQACKEDVVRIGVIGYGYWGPNIVRNLHGQKHCQAVMVCDQNPTALGLTSNSAQAEELVELAARKNLTIMVDHTFLFTGAVRKIKELTESGALGDLYYYDSLRVNLGLFQHDVSVIWDLAPHDLSIMDHIIKAEPEAIVATGEKHLNGVEDVAYLTLYFPRNIIAHINVNWLSPVKIRTTLIGGQKRMVVWNDLVADEKVRVYDKGVQISSGEGIRNLLVSYRSGDMWAPQLEQLEALHAELDYFSDCVMNNKKPFNDGHAGLRIVRMLEAAEKSIRQRGELIRL